MNSKEEQANELIEHLGGFGPFQLMTIGLLLYICNVCGTQNVNMVFVAYEPEYRCSVPACDSPNSTYHEDFLNFSIPYNEDKDRWHQCNAFQTSGDSLGCEESGFEQSKKVPCSQYVYDTSVFSNSVLTEFNLVCDRSWLLPLVKSAYMVGMAFGTIISGMFADALGRKKAILFFAILTVVGGFIASFSTNYYLFWFTRLFMGAGGIAIYQTGFILAMETVLPNRRTFIGLLIPLPFSITTATVAALAYGVRDWRWLQAVCTAPIILIFILWWFLPESIRWYLVKEKGKKAQNLVRRIEKMNKIEVPKHIYENLEPKNDIPISTIENIEQENLKSTKKTTNFFQLFRYSNTRKRTINLAYCWAVITLTFYGFNANSANLGGNIFINFMAIMLIGLPSQIVLFFILDTLGRKGTLMIVLLFGGIASFMAGVTPKEMDWLIVIFSIAGKFGSAAAFTAVYIYTVEIFPTSHRGAGLGTCSMCARIAGILAPFIADLGKTVHSLPFFVFGTLSITAGLSVIFLPETHGIKLPQNIETSEKFGIKQKIHHFLFWPRNSEKNSIKNC